MVILSMPDILPLSFLKINHTVRDEGTMSRTSTRSFTRAVQVVSMHIAIILSPVIIALRFLESG